MSEPRHVWLKRWGGELPAEYRSCHADEPGAIRAVITEGQEFDELMRKGRLLTRGGPTDLRIMMVAHSLLRDLLAYFGETP